MVECSMTTSLAAGARNVTFAIGVVGAWFQWFVECELKEWSWVAVSQFRGDLLYRSECARFQQWLHVAMVYIQDQVTTRPGRRV